MGIVAIGQATITDLTDGTNGTSSYTHIRYSAVATGNPMTTVATGALYIGVAVTTSATAPTGYASYAWSLIKGDKGDTGDNSISGVLSNDSHTIATDSAGAGGSFTNAVSTIKIFNGAVDDSANWAVTVAVSNITGTLSGKTYTVASLTADTGYVDFTATRSGYASVVKRFTLTKSKQGTTGGSGTTPTTYWLVNSAPAISKSASAVYTPSTITVTGKAQTGIGSPFDYAGRFIISDSPDGTTFTARYTSSANEVSKVYTPLANIKALKVQFYLAGGTTTLLDEQVISIVSDGAKGDDGGAGTPAYVHIAYATSSDGSAGFSTTVSTGKTFIGTCSNSTATKPTINTAYSWSLIKGIDGTNGNDAISGVLSNDAHVIATDSAGNGGVYTGAVSTIKILKGITDDSANWAVTVAVSGVTGSLSGKTYTATGLTADSGYVDFTATRSGYASIVKRFAITKSKQGSPNTTLSNAVTTIDGTGVTVKDGNFILEDSKTGSKYTVDAKTNLVKDSSFELIQHSDQYHTTYTGLMQVVNQNNSLSGWSRFGYAYVRPSYSTDFDKNDIMFGNKQVVVSLGNYLFQDIPVISIVNTPYTVSFFTKSAREGNMTTGTPRLRVDWLSGSDQHIATSATYTFPVPSTFLGEKVRYAQTIYVPNILTNDINPAMRIYIETTSATQWVEIDGVQVVQAERATSYIDESSLWEMVTGNQIADYMRIRSVEAESVSAMVKLYAEDADIMGHLNLYSQTDASGTSSTHALTIGSDTSGTSLKMDANEISAFNSTGVGELHVNPDGGRVVFNNNAGTGNVVIQDGKIAVTNAKMANTYNLATIRDGTAVHNEHMMILNIVVGVPTNNTAQAYADFTFPRAFSDVPIWVISAPQSVSSTVYKSAVYSPTQTGFRIYINHIHNSLFNGTIEVQVIACGMRT